MKKQTHKKEGAFTKLLATPMTRKQFIVHLGVLLFVLSGINSAVKTISNPQLSLKDKNDKKPRSGFGGGSYGNS